MVVMTKREIKLSLKEIKVINLGTKDEVKKVNISAILTK